VGPWESLGTPWESLGDLGDPFEVLGDTLGDPWRALGDTRGCQGGATSTQVAQNVIGLEIEDRRIEDWKLGA